MVYLLVNHVPFGKTDKAGRFRVGDLFLQDLRVQARAIAEAGGSLIVATPLVQNLSAMSGGSFNTVEMSPEECGFSYLPLPRYQSLREYLAVKNELKAKLKQGISQADIVQMDYGGHPFMLGEIAWPLATDLRKKRIWLFDGADPFPRMELDARKTRNPLKAFVKQRLIRQKLDFCRQAIRSADLVFAHNAAVVERFQADWNERCHAFDRSFVTDEVLISDLTPRIERFRDGSRPLRLVCAGRQIRIKGTDQVIHAVAKLRERQIPVELNVMGDGDDLPAFKQLAAELNLNDRVRFGGTVPYGQPLFDEWARCDIMLVTNLTAEISRNVLLSLARGLPLITYENPGTDALLREHQAARIVPRGNVDALAESIAEMHRDHELLVQLAENGLKLARCRTMDATHRRRAELAAGLLQTLSPSAT